MSKRRGRDEGSIRRRKDGLWEAVFSFGFDPATGKRIRKSVYARTKGEAVEKMRHVRATFTPGVLDVGSMTVGQFLSKDFLDVIKPEVRMNTYAQYEYVVRMYLVPGLGSVPMAKVTPLHVQSFLTALAEKKPAAEGTRRTSKPSDRLRQLCFAVLRRAFKTAVVLGVLGRNPCEGIKQPKVQVRRPELWTREQLQHFLEATKDDKFHAFWVLAVSTGARQGELLGLTWKDINLEAGTISISGTLIEARGHIEGVHAPKTRAGTRVVSIDAGAVQALKRHQAKLFARGLRACPIVFPNSRRNPGWMGKSSLTDQFKEAVEKAGLPMIRMHDLRHLSATMAIATGADIRTVSARLGHSKPSVTLDIYAHAFAGTDRKLSASLDELIFGPIPLREGRDK